MLYEFAYLSPYCPDSRNVRISYEIDICIHRATLSYMRSHHVTKWQNAVSLAVPHLPNSVKRWTSHYKVHDSGWHHHATPRLNNNNYSLHRFYYQPMVHNLYLVLCCVVLCCLVRGSAKESWKRLVSSLEGNPFFFLKILNCVVTYSKQLGSKAQIHHVHHMHSEIQHRGMQTHVLMDHQMWWSNANSRKQKSTICMHAYMSTVVALKKALLEADPEKDFLPINERSRISLGISPSSERRASPAYSLQSCAGVLKQPILSLGIWPPFFRSSRSPNFGFPSAF